MKAIVITKYGTPDVLQLREVEKPTPKDDQVRVKIHAASVGPADCAFRKGKPFIIKLMYGLRKPRMKIIGTEFAGVIDAVGRDVKGFAVGDPVMGLSVNSFGTHAEYMCMPIKEPLVKKPDALSFNEATAIMDGAPTALTFLRDIAKIQPGQTVLINGASGAVGAYGVQIAKAFGARVTGVCSGKNVDMVKSLGADNVIDYTQADFTQNGQRYDFIFDAVGKRTFANCKGSLTQNGVYLNTVPSFGIVWALLTGRKAKFAAAGLMLKNENLEVLKKFYEAGQLKAVIDRCYPLEQVPDAHRYVETERKTGNLVITVAG